MKRIYKQFSFYILQKFAVYGVFYFKYFILFVKLQYVANFCFSHVVIKKKYEMNKN